ncbi:MAG: transglutaminase family protein [Mogibacterium sp.]|nr:transglutaminase family protein [Mogibacterium sp.]
MLLDYTYTMNLHFSEPVEDQFFSLLCLPRETSRQRVAAESVHVQPETKISYDTDGFGNRMLYGAILQPHNGFLLNVHGLIETRQSLHEEYEEPDNVGLVRWLMPSALTVPGPALTELYRLWSSGAPEDPYLRMLHYGNCVQDALRYIPESTDVQTTAEDAVRLGSGVCQDYAHVLIALLRSAGLPARYVVGLMYGEGASHAWVEANLGGYWYGIDPTNNLLVDGNYIKFAHGRDYGDCMISRGIFRNPRAVQRMEVSVRVTDVTDDPQEPAPPEEA